LITILAWYRATNNSLPGFAPEIKFTRIQHMPRHHPASVANKLLCVITAMCVLHTKKIKSVGTTTGPAPPHTEPNPRSPAGNILAAGVDSPTGCDYK
jgi:hypothetical protein